MKLMVTRPQPGADELAQALRAAGFEAIVCPALVIEPRGAPACWPIARSDAIHRDAPDGVDSNLMTNDDSMARRGSDVVASADIFVFISPNAVRFGWRFCELRAADPRCRWFAVGPATATLLAAQGVRPIAPAPPGSSGALLALPQLREVMGMRVVIVRGVGGLATLGEVLARRGAQVDALEVYERKPASAVQLAAALAQVPDAILVSSGDGLGALLAAAATCGLSDTLRRIPLVVPSERVQAQARAHGLTNTRLIVGADTAAVVTALSGAALRDAGLDDAALERRRNPHG